MAKEKVSTNLTIQERISLIKERADQAALQWIKENEENIEYKIIKMLDERCEKIVAKLMGFENPWGKWEVDHCNGRAGESAAGDWLRQRAGESVRAWLDKQAGDLPDLPKSAINALKKEYLCILEELVKEELEEIAKEKMMKVVEELIGDIHGED